MGFILESMLDHFGLERRPFALVPDPSILYLTAQHARAQSILNYGIISCAPVTLITGEIGVGKTTIMRELLARAPQDLKIGLIANAAPADRAEMLRLVLLSLDQLPAVTESYAALYSQLESHLVEEYGAGRRVILIFDEAQNLDRESLEHLRMLTNINFAEHELLQLVLIGQSELLDLVRRPDLRQLAQRVSAHMHLTQLPVTEIEHYVKFRVKTAGGAGNLFAPDTYSQIFAHTAGTPRLVNQLCDYAMLYAYAAGDPSVAGHTIKAVINDRYILSLNAEPCAELA